MLVDERDQIWAGTSGEGLFRFVSGGFQSIPGAERVGSQIYVLFQSHDGKVWIGGRNGLGCHDERGWTIYSAADGLPASAVRAISDDGKGGLWIGTEGGGLFCDAKRRELSRPMRR